MSPPTEGTVRPSSDQFALTAESMWATLFWAGLILMAVGVVAMLVPLFVSVVLELLIGLSLLIAGAVQVVQAIQTRPYGGFWVNLISAAFSIVAGLILTTQPMVGLLAITVLFAAYLLVQGVAQIAYAMEIRPVSRTWIWTLISGIVSIVLGVMIWLRLPGDAAWIMGLLLGIYLLFTGSTMVVLSLSARRAFRQGDIWRVA